MSLTKITDSVVETFSRWFRVNSTTGAITSVIPDLSGSNTTLYPGYMCRAWVTFSMAGNITGGGNFDSYTSTGTGTGRVNFTISMPNTNYGALSTANTNTTDSNWLKIAGKITTHVNLEYTNSVGGNVANLTNGSVVVFR
jgi:hypothetical protein